MDNFSLLVTFISILAGLALTNLLYSLHLILRIRKDVNWHWMPLFWVFVCFQSMILMWYNLEKELDTHLIDTSIGFTLWLSPLILNLLFVMAILPDRQPEKGFNLLEWYFSQQRYFFSLLALFMIILTINRILMDQTPQNIFIHLSYIVIFILMAWSRKYWLHIALTSLTAISILLSIASQLFGLS